MKLIKLKSHKRDSPYCAKTKRLCSQGNTVLIVGDYFQNQTKKRKPLTDFRFSILIFWEQINDS